MLSEYLAVGQFQPTPVVRSNEKTLVNGRIYYIHTVRKGHTLYSISKAYEVTQEEIKNANPEVDVLNLVEGLAIRIPEVKSDQAAVYPVNKEDFHAHDVKRGQTVYSLSKKYDVDPEVIYHYNPWAREGIKPDQTVWIPKKKDLLDVSEANIEYYYYTVKEKDTLYTIARTYGVSVAQVIDANPELRNGLRSGQTLRIPKIQTVDRELTLTDSIPTDVPCITPEQNTFNVALMLPFFAAFNVEELEVPTDTLAEEGTYVPQQRQQGLRGKYFAEFYEGFILALDSLKQTGLSVILQVKDTERDTLRTKKLIREISQQQPDLIIGPVYSEDVNIAGRYARSGGIQLVSPLSTRTSLVEGNPNIIQIIPSKEAESYAMANYIKTFKKGRIILVRGMDSVSVKNSWRFKKYLLENMPVDESGKALYFQDCRLNDSLNNHLTKVLSREEENLLVVFSDDESSVNSLIMTLIQRASLYPVVLFGLPSWSTWTNIDLNFFHSLQLHIVSPFYTDYSDPAVKNFLKKCRRMYGYEPYEISPLGYNFSMLGYDIGFYFLSALQQYGKNFIHCLDQVDADLLLTKFNFQKAGYGGFMNNSFSVIRYRNDFAVEKIQIVDGIRVIPPAEIQAPSDSIVPYPIR
jgi:LysM repeat protein/ABC-type branched-subunit amino acid transport system substrate-binding protein